MAGKVFKIKRGDTLPILEVQLFHDGEAFDATGGTGYLRIRQTNGMHLRRTMVPEILASGVFRYTIVAADWGAGGDGSGTFADPYGSGGMIVSPYGVEERGPQHTMEYEVIGPNPQRVTFPEDDADNDIFHVSSDLGDEV